MMDLLDEAKEFVRLHAIAQGMDQREFASLLAGIDSIGGDGDADWTTRFVSRAELAQKRGDPAAAFEYANLARFPYVTTPSMLQAQHRAIALFNALGSKRPVPVTRRVCRFRDVDIPYYLYDCGRVAPILFVCGGIVSTKEQWRAFLDAGRKLGVSVLLAEMPGVGENILRYDRDSPAFISALLDDAREASHFTRAHLVAFSFSGNLALQQACVDARIAAVTTVGAPLHAFFNDRDWWTRVPKLTQQTLAHVCRTPPEALADTLPALALPEDTLKRSRVPLYYAGALRDEIIPAEELQRVRRDRPGARLIAFDDTHGAPSHFRLLKKFIISSILAETAQSALLRVAGRLQQGLLHARFGYHKSA